MRDAKIERADNEKQAVKAVEWTAQRKSQDKGESEEASAGNESDGRQKEIADETIVGQCVEVARLKPPLDESGYIR